MNDSFVKGVSMKQIKTVIFDIGQVLVEFDWKSYIRGLGFSEKTNLELGKVIFSNPLWKERDRGDKSEEEYIEDFISLAPHLEKEIRLVFLNVVDIVEVFPYANEWIKTIKAQGYKVFLLSNYSKRSFEHDMNQFEFLQYIDGKVISYEIQHVKPEPEIYKVLIDKYNIIPEEAVFLDDVEENLEGAKSFGINTILVDSYENAIKELERLGITL